MMGEREKRCPLCGDAALEQSTDRLYHSWCWYCRNCGVYLEQDKQSILVEARRPIQPEWLDRVTQLEAQRDVLADKLAYDRCPNSWLYPSRHWNGCRYSEGQCADIDTGCGGEQREKCWLLWSAEQAAERLEVRDGKVPEASNSH